MAEPAPGGGLVGAAIDLVRDLRREGSGAGLNGAVAAVRAMAALGCASPDDLRTGLAAGLAVGPEERPRFDHLFTVHFMGRDRGEADEPEAVTDRLPARPDDDLALPPGAVLARTGRPGDLTAAVYSPRKSLAGRDLGKLDPAEARAAEAWLIQALALPPARPGRRSGGRVGARVDFRRTMRRSVSLDGEIIGLLTVGRRPKARPVSFILDLSGSMSRYGRFLLLLGRAALRSWPRGRVEVHGFSTRAHRLTDLLTDPSLDRAWARVAGRMTDLSGGTRIGQCFQVILDQNGPGRIRSGSVTVVFSDGWDRGRLDLLDQQTARLKRRSRRLIWLNPLLGSPDYRPLAVGVRTVAPYIDHFITAHSPAALVRALGRIEQAAQP